MLFNGLPLYEGKIIDEECGMYAISLVDDPATESNFLAFSKDRMTFTIANEEQRMVFGLVMASNLAIYRRDKSGYEYFIIYRPETLRIMAEKYLKDGFQNTVDLNHDGVPVEGVNMVQMFIKDTEKGINPKGFEDYDDGSLFAQFHVENDEIWQQIKDGTFKGFSLAGLFSVEEAEFKKLNKQEKINKFSMKIEKIKEALRKILASFGSIATDKGTVIWEGEDELKEGDSVHGIDEEGNSIDLEDGVYNTEDQKAITIAEGKVVTIEDLDAEVAPQAPAEEPEEPANEEPQENEEPASEEPSNEEPANEPDERDERIANLEAEIARLEEENGALKERIKELEGEPAASPAGEEFKKAEEKVSPEMEKMIKRGYKFVQ